MSTISKLKSRSRTNQGTVEEIFVLRGNMNDGPHNGETITSIDAYYLSKGPKNILCRLVFPTEKHLKPLEEDDEKFIINQVIDESILNKAELDFEEIRENLETTGDLDDEEIELELESYKFETFVKVKMKDKRSEGSYWIKSLIPFEEGDQDIIDKFMKTKKYKDLVIERHKKDN